jgi:RimJ/RimL family protein N-acetyltransferase
LTTTPGQQAIAIETLRLHLRPYTPADLVALIEGVPQFSARLGLPVADGLRAFLVSDEVSPEWLDRLRATVAWPANPWVYGYGVVHRETNTVVGTAGFKGPPDEDGVVEIAYGIVPSHEGRGLATEVAAALVDFASTSGVVRTVRAHTLPQPNASTRVLTKCGFTFVGEVVDPEDGLVWRWERPSGSPPALIR